MLIKKFENYSSWSSLNEVDFNILKELKDKLPLVKVDIFLFYDLLEEIRIDYYDIDSGKFDPTLFEVREIYNNPHDSDESSCRYILFFKGELNSVFGRTGDRGYTFLEFKDKESFQELYNYFISLQESTFNLDISDSVNLEDEYTNVLIMDGELYYNLKSPKWGFYDKKKPFYELVSDDKLVEIEFKRYKTDKKSYEEREPDKFIIAKRDGKEVEIPYYKVFQKQTK